ncbi:MAG TPA: TetR/AcrR family transcriptional regulator [Polyangiaceae bacterium]|jgi:AcrR family transcriptional regulator
MGIAKGEPSARDRLLAAADELFYEEGVHTVGIDRVIERAGVAKASLYTSFGSKEELVRAYLEGRAATRRARIEDRIARVAGPREKILAVFEAMEERVVEPDFRGCAFVNASVEGPPGPSRVRQACADSRAWLRDLFTRLARESGAKDAARVGRRLALLYDGAIVGAPLERDPALVAGEARAMAEEVLDALVPSKRAVTKKRG